MYRDLNDYEILYMVKDDSEYNFDILVDKYKPLIYKIVKNYLSLFKKYGYELDDLMQIGFLTLYKSSQLYDIYNKSMFYTYFKSALQNAIINEMRINTTRKREVLNNSFSYDKEIDNTDIRFIDLFGSEKKDNENKVNNLIIFKNSMPFDLSCVFELLYNGYSIKEISLLLEEECSFIKKMIKRIKEHAFTYKYLFFE